jgi:8-oxo-dGTP diphosphatase
MSFETHCEFSLKKGSETIIDHRRAQLLRGIERLGSIDRAAGELDISRQEAEMWLDQTARGTGAPVAIFRADGKAELTAAGRSLLSEFGMRSRVADSQVKNLWKKPWVTADGIVIIEDQILLIKRGREPFKGMYALPGGIVEYGETVEQCVVREVEEETGLKTRILDLVGAYSAPDRDPRGHYITLAYNLHPIGGRLLGGDDASEARLFPLDALPEMATDHRTILSDAMGKRDQSRSRTGLGTH